MIHYLKFLSFIFISSKIYPSLVYKSLFGYIVTIVLFSNYNEEQPCWNSVTVASIMATRIRSITHRFTNGYRLCVSDSSFALDLSSSIELYNSQRISVCLLVLSRPLITSKRARILRSEVACLKSSFALTIVQASYCRLF